MSTGSLYLLPTFLGDRDQRLLSQRSLDVTCRLKYFVAEDAKSARSFLKAIQHPMPLQEIVIAELNEHTLPESVAPLLRPVLDGHDCGIISEAGLPGIADPGAALVRLAQQKGIRVHPIAGSSSLFLALMASGLNGQSFRFHGYLPRDHAARRQRLIELEKEVRRNGTTQLFIETPYRNDALFDDILRTCDPSLLLCIAVDLETEQELVQTSSLADWKKKKPGLHKRPCVFILGA
ncbi:MAG: SAM-dependent methyltransferase [Bacteroidia bacterium]|jgi:16S rRNA (cytidine1402-2'-O)-methyltransferase|uniref:SAM-dependent methyltransferase n=1 Tax=Candidatus Pollutiaquabacter sp. TaxID=3416354 RepID=UPI001A4A1BEF|nr:SAM-dependent methyltransferase [Bacteroidota bacterium]MBL7947418.1 SAM-dependent methyltransferase [Bacteroidia bacterium]MBP6010069.1 SAM-dependent methyltransferase [Bacteroidia bacterium]MBP7270205.1 SAM-dependent methyltransferase [Bacteroidia bacterium]MBP7437336.1 SAM-dependent methyltransferase [Bacteroidia bacterium]